MLAASVLLAAGQKFMADGSHRSRKNCCAFVADSGTVVHPPKREAGAGTACQELVCCREELLSSKKDDSKPAQAATICPPPTFRMESAGGAFVVLSKTVIWLTAVWPDQVTLICADPTALSCQNSGLSTDTTDGCDDAAATASGSG